MILSYIVIWFLSQSFFRLIPYRKRWLLKGRRMILQCIKGVAIYLVDIGRMVLFIMKGSISKTKTILYLGGRPLCLNTKKSLIM